MNLRSLTPLVLMNENRLRICILGGGFGGLYTSLRLSQLPWEAQEPQKITLFLEDPY